MQPRYVASYLFTALFALSLTPSPALAQSQTTDIRPNAERLTDDDILKDFKGVTHEGAYRFSYDGKPGRFYTETHHASGRTSYKEDGVAADGVWIVKKDGLCFVYDSQDMSGGCFRVYKVGNCFYFYSQTLPLRSDELGEDYWTARSVKKGETPTCEPGIS